MAEVLLFEKCIVNIIPLYVCLLNVVRIFVIKFALVITTIVVLLIIFILHNTFATGYISVR